MVDKVINHKSKLHESGKYELLAVAFSKTLLRITYIYIYNYSTKITNTNEKCKLNLIKNIYKGRLSGTD